MKTQLVIRLTVNHPNDFSHNDIKNVVKEKLTDLKQKLLETEDATITGNISVKVQDR